MASFISLTLTILATPACVVCNVRCILSFTVLTMLSFSVHFAVTLDAECNSDLECSNEKACINFQCIDPCELRGACGLNALCRTVLHRPRCSCPACHIGAANTECRPDPNCLSTQPRPSTTQCTRNTHCSLNQACNPSLGECYDPCANPSFKCRGNKRCEVSHHRPTCVCKGGFVVNERGEIACAPEISECSRNDQCPSNRACIENVCQNPCTALKQSPCPPEKGCDVLNHKPVCICLKNCNPSLSICLRDNGCPAHQACRAFRCEDPCATASCPENTPCYVEDHKPICKFCPPGFKSDSKYGCLKGKHLFRCKLLVLDDKTSKNDEFRFAFGYSMQ